jgi:cobalt/nickel transport system permease protein
MHIPDNFLSTPVWLGFDVVSVPTLGLIARGVTRQMEDSRIPMFGVLGAFVFAAQMINFPVGIGTSGHLVGGALLACTLGPAAASVVMTAILMVQAFVFQDGGVLALGANVFNMAIAGVFAGYLPYQIWGATRWRKASILVSAALALSELLVSGVAMPRSVVFLSLILFCVSALLEGAITVSVLEAVERLNPGWVRKPAARAQRASQFLAAAAVFLVAIGFLFASTAPDGLERLGQQLGISAQAVLVAPLADYTLPGIGSPWLRRAIAGLAGLAVVYGVCTLFGRFLRRQRTT